LFAQAGPALVLDRWDECWLPIPLLCSCWTQPQRPSQQRPSGRFPRASHPRWQEVLHQVTVNRAESRGLPDLMPVSAQAQVSLGARRVEFAAPLVQARRVLGIQLMLRPVDMAESDLSLARQQRTTMALQQVMSVVNSTLDLNAVLDAIIDRLQDVVPYDSASLLLNEQGRYRLVMTRGLTPPLETALAEQVNDLRPFTLAAAGPRPHLHPRYPIGSALVEPGRQ
jgi:hypothetical protein